MSRLAPLSICALVLTALLPAAAIAQPRAATALVGLRPQPAVMLARDRAWIAPFDPAAPPRTLCTETLCRPIVRAEACTAPQCPGSGGMVWASEPIAEVAEWPTDREGFAAAQSALYAEVALGPLTAYFLPHPAPPPEPARPARFSRGENDWWRLELLLGAGIATGLLHITAPMWQADAAIGWRFRPREIPDEGLDLMYGTQMGLELRGHVLGNVTGQSDADLAIFLGIGPGFSFVDYDAPFRVPPLFAALIPEVGVVVRTDRVPPAWYMGWSLPVAVLFEEHMGIEARASLLVIDDWYPGDDAELIGSLTLQVLIR